MVMLVSCDDDSDTGNGEITADDTFIFGHFYGECFGENCVEIFKIENGMLYEDTKDLYPNGMSADYDWTLLEESKYQLVRSFPDLFPNELLEESEVTIGQPDAGDWGGYVIGKNIDNELRMWLIDTMDDNIPDYLHEYNDEIGATINLLK